MSEEILPDLCPECGAGFVMVERSGRDERVFRLPKNWPANRECLECKRRSLVRAEQLGHRMAEKQERKFLEQFGAT